MIQDLSNHIFVWRELKELNKTLSGKKNKTCVDPMPPFVPGTPENCPGTTTNGVSNMRVRKNKEKVRRIGVTGSSESDAWRNEDMKQGLYRANDKLYEEPPTDDCKYNSNNTLQDLNYLTKDPCDFDLKTALTVEDYDNNWENLKEVIKKIRDINGNKKTFIFSGHQHNLQNMFFKFKKNAPSNLNYGFANCACIKVTFDINMNIQSVNMVYQGMDTEKGVMLDSNNDIQLSPSKNDKYGYVNGNLDKVLDFPSVVNYTIQGSSNDQSITAIFIRHGQAFHNKPHEVKRNDSLLTPEGIKGSLEINIGKELQLQECVFLTSPLIRCIMTLCGFIKSSVNYTGNDQFKVNIDQIFSKIIDISVRRLTSGDYKKTFSPNKISEFADEFLRIRNENIRLEDEKQRQYYIEESKRQSTLHLPPPPPAEEEFKGPRGRSNAVINREEASGGQKKRKTKRRKRNKTKKHKGKKQKRSKRRNKKTHK